MNRKTLKALSIISFTLVFVFFVAGSQLVSAVTVSPASGSYAAGSTQTINIVAAPTASGQNAVSLRLTFTGMTVTGFTDPSGFIGVTPDCSGSVKYTSNSVCVSMAKTTDIQAGDSLGTVTVTMGSAGTATVIKDSGTSYSDGTTVVGSTGTGATYTVTAAGGSQNPPGTLPNTAQPNDPGVLYMFLGLLFVSLGALSYFSIETYNKRYNFQVK